MTRMSIGAASLVLCLSAVVSAQAQEPPPAPVVLQPLPAPGTAPVAPAAQPAPQPQPVQPQPGQPNVIIVQPTPAQPAPVVQPPAQPPAVYVYELPPPPSYSYAPPPPPAPPKPMKRAGVHTHDGFYLRMGLGLGAVAVSSTRKSGDSDSLSTGGGAIEFGMGGTLGEGFVLGGRLIGVGGDSLRLESTDQRANVDGSLFYSTVQLFADWYLDPESGLHLEAALGPAGLTYDPTPSSRSDDEYEGDEVTFDGFGGSLGVGWEGWIGEQWSLGGLFRLNWATYDGVFDASTPDEPLRASVDTDDDTGRIVAVVPMFMLTGTFH